VASKPSAMRRYDQNPVSRLSRSMVTSTRKSFGNQKLTEYRRNNLTYDDLKPPKSGNVLAKKVHLELVKARAEKKKVLKQFQALSDALLAARRQRKECSTKEFKRLLQEREMVVRALRYDILVKLHHERPPSTHLCDLYNQECDEMLQITINETAHDEECIDKYRTLIFKSSLMLVSSAYLRDEHRVLTRYLIKETNPIGKLLYKSSLFRQVLNGIKIAKGRVRLGPRYPDFDMEEASKFSRVALRNIIKGLYTKDASTTRGYFKDDVLEKFSEALIREKSAVHDLVQTHLAEDDTRVEDTIKEMRLVNFELYSDLLSLDYTFIVHHTLHLKTAFDDELFAVSIPRAYHLVLHSAYGPKPDWKVADLRWRDVPSFSTTLDNIEPFKPLNRGSVKSSSFIDEVYRVF